MPVMLGLDDVGEVEDLLARWIRTAAKALQIKYGLPADSAHSAYRVLSPTDPQLRIGE